MSTPELRGLDDARTSQGRCRDRCSLLHARQYGPNSLNVSPALLTKAVSLTGTSFTDGDLQGWVNDLASANGFGSDHCIFVPVPPGVSAHDVGENAGYHKKANIPYVVAGVTTGLTLADNADVYAMVVSHVIAEMVVDPNADGNNPEVCDPCDINCSNLTRCYDHARPASVPDRGDPL